MSQRLSITIEDDLYEELKVSSLDNERSIAQEVTFRLKKFKGLSGLSVVHGGEVSVPSYTTSASTGEEYRVSVEDTKKLESVQEEILSSAFSEKQLEVIKKLDVINSEGYQPDGDELSRLRKDVVSVGWTYNDKSRSLWELNKDTNKWKMIKQY